MTRRVPHFIQLRRRGRAQREPAPRPAKRLRTLAITLSLLLLYAGCGGGSSSSSPTTLRIWYGTDDATERVWSQQLARQYAAAHPGVRVQLADYSFEDLNTKLQLALSGGNPPDLAYVTPRGPGIPAYVGAHKLRDLTDTARSEGWAGRLRSGLLAQYNRPFGYLGAPKGHIMAVPMGVAAVGILFNRRLLDGLHLGVPRTMGEFEGALARANTAGYVPLGLGNADGWLGDDWYLTLANALAPADQLAAEGRLSPSFTFKAPPYLLAARILKLWADCHYFTPSFGGLDAQEGVQEFFKGKTLFQMVSSSENSQIAQEEARTKLPIGIFAFPTPDGRGVMPSSGYLGWVVPAAARNAPAALSFIRSTISANTARFLLRQGVLPAAVLPPTAPAHVLTAQTLPWQRQYLSALDTARPGVYLDAAPVANLNATMESNVQLLLQGYEPPESLVNFLQEVYASHGNRGSRARIDGEF